MSPRPKPASAHWLLLIYQLPAKPAYLRIKIGRKLQALGAVPVKNAAHALPATAKARASYAVLLEEILQGGGEGLVCEARLIDGLDDATVRGLFDAARDADYQDLGRKCTKALKGQRLTGADARRLRRRFDEIAATDFFGAHGRQATDNILIEVERQAFRHPDVNRTEAPPGLARVSLRKRIWVTRRHIHVDRIASAWLIRRFIDPDAVFKFVDTKTYKWRKDHLRFDMADAEFTHEGKDCTFETLMRRTDLGADAAIRAISEIIHDLDVEEDKFDRPEVAGVRAMIAGVCASTSSDEERLKLGATGLDQFYSYFSKSRK